MALTLLNHVTDTELAVRFAESICGHAHKRHGQSNDSVRKMLDAVDWKHCQQQGLSALVAMKLAGCWLNCCAGVLLSISISVDDSDAFPGNSYYGPRISEGDLPILRSILNFAMSVFKEENPLALKCMSGQNHQTQVLAHYKKLATWAEKIREAVLRGGESFDVYLATKLIKDEDSIPLSFIRFLAEQDEDSKAGLDKTRVLQAFQTSLLSDISASKLQKILPATDEARKTSKAAFLLNQWLEQTIRNGSSKDLKEKIKLHQENVKKAQLPSFPECRGEDVKKDPALQEAVRVFMDSAHPTVGSVGSDFIDREARGILNSDSLDSLKLWEEDCQRNPLRVPALARQKAKQIILGALQGKKTHDEVRLPVLDSAIKREQIALHALLLDAEVSPSSIQLFLRLVQVDPGRLLNWSEQLSEFLRNHLQLELPPVLEGFLETYGSKSVKNIKKIKMFVESDFLHQIESPVSPSAHHMLFTFQNMLKDVKQAAWSQISSLADLSSLIQIFRDKIVNKETLERKMNVLRMMCVSNRSMTKAVNILDELQPSLFLMTNSKRHETVMSSICNLLNAGVLNRAVAANISLSQLCTLFSFAEGGDDAAKRNSELLRSARIVLDVQRLRRYADDPLTQKTAIDTVRVETKGHDFRLAGGHTCAKLVGQSDIESLFVEIQIQLSASQAQKYQGKDPTSENSDILDLISLVEEVHERVRKVFDLAEHIFKALALGGDLREQGEQRIIEFPSQAPAQSRSLYEDVTDTYEIDHLHDIKPLWQSIERPNSLMERLSKARTRFPFISFACPLDIMKRKV